MEKIVFFDLNIIGVARYPLQIANEINKQKKNVEFYFLYEEDTDNKLNEIKKLLPKNSKLIRIKKANYKYLKSLFQNINPKSLLVMAQRIPDNAIVSIANELGIDTYKFQHGLYIPFMKRNISMFFEKLRKTIRYMQYALVVAESTKQPKIKTLKEYIDVFIKGKNITKTSLPIDKINAKKVFVYGEYWKQYHKEQYGYSLEQQVVVGYPDLMILDEIKKKPQEDAVCYICQTLVEDGRLPRDQMLEFVDILSSVIGDKKLYIKLHPRSDLSLYKKLENKSNVIFLKDGFPYCKKYIGHYSSLLAIAMYLTDEIYLWKFENHNEYPFYFVDNTKVFSNSITELKKFIKDSKEENIFIREIEKFFFFNNTTIKEISSMLGL